MGKESSPRTFISFFFSGLSAILLLGALAFFLRSSYQILVEPLGPIIANGLLALTCLLLSGLSFWLSHSKVKAT